MWWRSKLHAVNRPTLWWRLRSLWGATLAGFGWTSNRSVISYAQKPPRRRFWHIFRPPPPRPDFQPLTQPSWVGPPESEIGVAVPMREVLASDPGVVIALIDCVAFSNGFEFGIAVRTKEEIDSRAMGFGPPPFGTERPEQQLQIGVQFADGRRAITGTHPGPQFYAHLEATREGLEPELPDGPILSPRSGGGGGRRWDFRYWAWPLPPEGRLTFICEWPARGLALTFHDVDATEIRRAGSASTKLWNDA